MKDEICFVKTSEWWSGNYYPDGTTFYQRYGMSARNNIDYDDPSTWSGQEYVKLQLFVVDSSSPDRRFVCVYVSGNDDVAMSKTFQVEEYEIAKDLYEELKSKGNLTKVLLKEKEFEYS